MIRFLLICLLATTSICLAEEKRVLIADDKISLIVPQGWKKSEQNLDTTLAGWESPDQKASFFFQPMTSDVNLSMKELMDLTVDQFEKNEGLEFQKIGPYKTGQVKGSKKPFPAIYTTMDMVFKASQKDIELKYYLLIFDVGAQQYFLQASINKPVWDVREKQILEMIQSLVARKLRRQEPL